jgi:hypothetical protein
MRFIYLLWIALLQFHLDFFIINILFALLNLKRHYVILTSIGYVLMKNLRFFTFKIFKDPLLHLYWYLFLFLFLLYLFLFFKNKRWRLLNFLFYLFHFLLNFLSKFKRIIAKDGILLCFKVIGFIGIIKVD